MGRLDGKVAVITGGTTGIGEATVDLFVQEGAKVVFSGRNVEAGQAIQARHPTATSVFVRCDVMKEADIEKTILTAKEAFGRLDILFNNAGGPDAPPGRRPENLPDGDFDEEYVKHSMWYLFGSVVMGTKHAARIMREQGSGSIINNSSMAAQQGNHGSPMYGAAKAAISNYIKHCVHWLGPSGIRVNAISPGAIATPIFWGGQTNNKLSDEHFKKAMARLDQGMADQAPTKLKSGRGGRSLDIAYAALYLASDESEWVSGVDFIVDAGVNAVRGDHQGPRRVAEGAYKKRLAFLEKQRAKEAPPAKL
mmetsp:Transcript_93673/g.190686  ORF Transcript_93673/g.190686 Transcript_93673/m.190686 type:complete len:308 (-) Transcript_93673:28-951(-)